MKLTDLLYERFTLSQQDTLRRRMGWTEYQFTYWTKRPELWDETKLRLWHNVLAEHMPKMTLTEWHVTWNIGKEKITSLQEV